MVFLSVLNLRLLILVLLLPTEVLNKVTEFFSSGRDYRLKVSLLMEVFNFPNLELNTCI